MYAAIGAMFAFMGGIVYYSTYDIPELEKSELELLSVNVVEIDSCLLYTSPSPRDRTRSRMPSSA